MCIYLYNIIVYRDQGSGMYGILCVYTYIYIYTYYILLYWMKIFGLTCIHYNIQYMYIWISAAAAWQVTKIRSIILKNVFFSRRQVTDTRLLKYKWKDSWRPRTQYTYYLMMIIIIIIILYTYIFVNGKAKIPYNYYCVYVDTVIFLYIRTVILLNCKHFTLPI